MSRFFLLIVFFFTTSGFSGSFTEEEAIPYFANGISEKDLQRGLLSEANLLASFMVEDSVNSVFYSPKEKVYDIEEKEWKSVTVKVYTPSIEYDGNRMIIDGGNMNDYGQNCDILLYIDNTTIGRVGVEFDGNFTIHSVWNFEPEKYKNVGKLLMREIVNSVLKKAKHLPHLTTAEMRNYMHWVENKQIFVDSVFEAMVFYDKLGFKLENPKQKIVSEPLFPDYKEQLEALETYSSTRFIKTDDDFYEGFSCYKRQLKKIRVDFNISGITFRFSNGSPTEKDWAHFLIFRRCYYTHGSLRNERLEYQEFVKEFPNLRNYLDVKPFQETAEKVLEKEKKRYQTRGPRKGMHGSIRMALDKKKSILWKD